MTESRAASTRDSTSRELEPEQGSLAWPPRTTGRRGRLGEGRGRGAAQGRAGSPTTTPDDAVWEKLTRTTLDGIDVAPLGTRRPATTWPPAGRRPRGGALGHPRAPRRRRREGRQRGGAGRPRERRHLALAAAPSAGRRTPTRPTLLETACCSTSRPWCSPPGRPGRRAARSRGHRGAGREPAPGTNLGADPVGDRVRGDDGDLATSRRGGRTPRDAGVLGVVVDATAVHDLGASDAQELGYSHGRRRGVPPHPHRRRLDRARRRGRA